MVNVNDILTTKYYQLLQAALPTTKILRDYAPYDLVKDVDIYVLISAINSTDAGTMQSDDTDTSIQIGIYSRTTTDNNGDAVESIASTIYQTIKQSPLNTITLSGVQVMTTEFISDDSPAPFDTGSQLFINRFIRFKHKIFHSLN